MGVVLLVMASAYVGEAVGGAGWVVSASFFDSDWAEGEGWGGGAEVCGAFAGVTISDVMVGFILGGEGGESCLVGVVGAVGGARVVGSAGSGEVAMVSLSFMMDWMWISSRFSDLFRFSRYSFVGAGVAGSFAPLGEDVVVSMGVVWGVFVGAGVVRGWFLSNFSG